MIETKLYLPFSGKDGEKEIEAFLKLCVLPRFDGFITYKATRNWRDAPENMIVLQIRHSHSDIDIQTIARIYCHVFNQHWILRTDQEVSIEIIRK